MSLYANGEDYKRELSQVAIQEGIKKALGIEKQIDWIFNAKAKDSTTVEVALVDDNEIVALMKCIPSIVDESEYAQEINELFKYDSLIKSNILLNGFRYKNKTKVVLLMPSVVLSKNEFDIAQTVLPQDCISLELNENSKAVRTLSSKDYQVMTKARATDLVILSPYYFRDNRLFEYYILLKHLLIKSNAGYEKCDRKTEESFLMQVNTINNGNWRNAFITIANLGLIDSENIPTEAGKKLARASYENFAKRMYFSYIEPYYYVISECFDNKSSMEMSNQDILKKIKLRYHNKDVLFLTQSEGRYISSWMNILRDDFGIIDFKARSNYRIIKYNPAELSDEEFEEKIRMNSVAYEYISRYENLASYMSGDSFDANDNSLDELFGIIKEDEIVNVDEYNAKFNPYSVKMVIETLETKRDILRFDDGCYITLKKLMQAGITKRDIEDYSNQVVANVGDREIFTIKSLGNSQIGKLEEYGFDDVFFNSILESDSRLSHTSICDTVIFSKDRDSLSLRNVLEKLIKRKNRISVDELLYDLHDIYGIDISKANLNARCRKYGFYHDEYLDYVYLDYNSYYEDV
nr:hypothetical protein [uncultured Butyrivibrio sp.]